MSQVIPASARHYQAVCGLALVAIFLVQYLQNVYMPLNLVLLCVGGVCILYRSRVTPLLIFLAIAVAQLMEQYDLNQFIDPDLRPFHFLELTDVLLCMATLAYLIGQYRLDGLRSHVFPYDAREYAKTTTTPPAPTSPQARSEGTMTLEELAWLIIPIPGFVLAAEVLMVLLKQRWTLAGFPPRWRLFLAIAWLLLIVMFAAAHLFRHWRRLQMDAATAQLMLHDDLWNETRGEQRRIQRWFAWRRLKEQEER